MVQGVQKREQATLGALRRKSKKAVTRALIFLFVLFTVLLQLFIYFELINPLFIQTFFWPNAPQDK